MRVGIVNFAGSPCARAAREDLWRFGHEPVPLEPRARALAPCEAVILPGGGSVGGSARCGTLARLSPLMEAVVDFARGGGPVLGICEGFQLLIQLGLLPGLLLPGASRRYVTRQVAVEVESTASPFTRRYSRGEHLRVLVSHMDARYYIDEETLRRLEEEGRIAFRFVEEEEGGFEGVAGLLNEWGNVLGMMPHPEQATLERALATLDGERLLDSFLS